MVDLRSISSINRVRANIEAERFQQSPAHILETLSITPHKMALERVEGEFSAAVRETYTHLRQVRASYRQLIEAHKVLHAVGRAHASLFTPLDEFGTIASHYYTQVIHRGRHREANLYPAEIKARVNAAETARVSAVHGVLTALAAQRKAFATPSPFTVALLDGLHKQSYLELLRKELRTNDKYRADAGHYLKAGKSWGQGFWHYDPRTTARWSELAGSADMPDPVLSRSLVVSSIVRPQFAKLSKECVFVLDTCAGLTREFKQECGDEVKKILHYLFLREELLRGQACGTLDEVTIASHHALQTELATTLQRRGDTPQMINSLELYGYINEEDAEVLREGLGGQRNEPSISPPNHIPTRREVRDEVRAAVAQSKEDAERAQLSALIRSYTSPDTQKNALAHSGPLVFVTEGVKRDFEKWRDTLHPEEAHIITESLKQLCAAQVCDIAPIKAQRGVYELRIMSFGKRIYFSFNAKIGYTILAFGDKDTQDADVLLAKKRFLESA